MTPTSVTVPQAPVPVQRSACSLMLEEWPDGRMVAHVGGHAVPVSARLCFPWSQPHQYVSLRDDEDDEVYLVRDPGDLDPGSREVLNRALDETGFVLEIEAIEGVDEELDLRCWTVRTRQGPRRFQTPLDDWPQPLPGGGLLIQDIGGDQFRIANPASLDRRSRSLLWAFADLA